jgi:folate-binding protein YgfZ
LLDLPGAVPAEGADAGVAAYYGDPLREQRRLEDSAAIVDRSHREVLTVTGPDRLSWLHSITSQHLSALPPMHGSEALVLSPHGHVEHHLLIADDGETTWIDVEPDTGTALLGYLESMRFMLRVEPRNVTADWGVLSLIGPGTSEAVKIADSEYAVTPVDGGGLARRMPWPEVGGADLIVPRSRLRDLVAGLGVRPAGLAAYEALRVAARRPRLGWETDHRTIPHEVGWIGVAVHLDKGCYRGQETVARVHNLGRPPRRLVLCHLDGSMDSLPPHGSVVLWDDRPAGFVGTGVRHYELGPVALALVKRAVPDGAELEAAGVPIKVDG